MKPESKSMIRATVLPRAERAVAEQAHPRMLFPHTISAAYANSRQAKKAAIEIVTDQLRGVVAINKSVVATETSLIKQQVFLSYTDRVKALTPAVVKGAVEINAAIEQARPFAYAVIDDAFNASMNVIKESAEQGVITQEDAKRRTVESARAYRQDESDLNALIAEAKETNKLIANAAVARVKGLFSSGPDDGFLEALG